MLMAQQQAAPPPALELQQEPLGQPQQGQVPLPAQVLLLTAQQELQAAQQALAAPPIRLLHSQQPLAATPLQLVAPPAP